MELPGPALITVTAQGGGHWPGLHHPSQAPGSPGPQQRGPDAVFCLDSCGLAGLPAWALPFREPWTRVASLALSAWTLPSRGPGPQRSLQLPPAPRLHLEALGVIALQCQASH